MQGLTSLSEFILKMCRQHSSVMWLHVLSFILGKWVIHKNIKNTINLMRSIQTTFLAILSLKINWLTFNSTQGLHFTIGEVSILTLVELSLNGGLRIAPFSLSTRSSGRSIFTHLFDMFIALVCLHGLKHFPISTKGRDW